MLFFESSLKSLYNVSKCLHIPQQQQQQQQQQHKSYCLECVKRPISENIRENDAQIQLREKISQKYI